jgi:hypothetical protein
LGESDIGKLLDGILLGTVACILLYTALGLLLVGIHADMIAAKMELLLRYDMRPLIAPDDPYLQSFHRRLGSALIIGIPLGTLTALFVAALSIVPWTRGRWGKTTEPLLTLLLIPVFLYLTFSRDLPVLSVLWAVLAPVFFWIPWIYLQKRRKSKRRNRLRLTLFALLLLLPIASVSAFSSLAVRDMLMGLPTGNLLTNFYYDHTLLSAHVIKPVAYQTQRVVAVAEDVDLSEPVDSGSLIIKGRDACALKDASLVISKKELACPSFLLSPADAASLSQVIMMKASKRFDRNKALRRGIRWFFKGGFWVALLLLILRFTIFLEDVYERRKTVAFLLLLAGLLLPARGLYNQILLHSLETTPYIRAHEYASSNSATKRYLSVVHASYDLSQEELSLLSSDPSPRVRHYAFVAMGQHRDPTFLSSLTKGTTDPEQIVRTKVYKALGEIGGAAAISLLDEAIKQDPSWYARDYAYKARGDIDRIYKIVELF